MADKHKILIIEDDLDTIDLLETVLRTGGYEPLSGVGGVGGLRRLREAGADLILLDLMMHDMDGWSVLRALHADPDLRHVPVIILSVRSPLEDPERIEDCGDMFVDFVRKPFSIHDLLDRIACVLAGDE